MRNPTHTLRVGLDDKRDGPDDSHFDERDLDRDDNHDSEQKTDVQRSRDDDEFKTQDDGADEQPRERKRRCVSTRCMQAYSISHLELMTVSQRTPTR